MAWGGHKMNAESLDVVNRIVQGDDLQFTAVAGAASTSRIAANASTLRMVSLTFNRLRRLPERWPQSTAVAAIGIQGILRG